jgi:DNA topoisomerase-1
VSAVDSSDIADAAGLRYLPDDRPGITRRRRGQGFSYHNRHGNVVAPGTRDRIRRLVIPPAWHDVWIAPEPDAHLQATGIDDADRKQYLYHAAWREAADSAKFDRLCGFAPALERLRRRVANDLRARNGDVLCAIAARLVDCCLIRPGSRRRSAISDAVGATTLSCDDVDVVQGRIVLDFEGKSGVEHHLEVRDPALARIISDLLDCTDSGEPLFSTPGGDNVDERRLNQYIADASRSNYTAKDVRTWGATSIVVGELGPRNADAYGDRCGDVIRSAIEAAAEALGNSPAVCRSSYVAPAVLETFERGRMAEHWRRSRRGMWLSRAERATARVLSDGQ